MRSHLTPSEHALWQRLRARALGVTSRRQVPVGRHIADFLAPTARLIVEVDGGYDRRRRVADARRDRDDGNRICLGGGGHDLVFDPFLHDAVRGG